MHPRGSQGGAAATRAGDTDLAEAEAEALRQDDLKEISVNENRKGSCTYRMDGARTRAPAGSTRKIDAAKARQKARVMKAAALVIKL